MSRTLKDRPHRVKYAEKAKKGQIVHRHEGGVCIESDQPTWGWSIHEPGCTSRERVVEYCTFQEAKAAGGLFGSRVFTGTPEQAAKLLSGTHRGGPFGSQIMCHRLIPAEISGLDHWKWTGCVGHPKVVSTGEACNCAQVPTCGPDHWGIQDCGKCRCRRDRDDRGRMRAAARTEARMEMRSANTPNYSRDVAYMEDEAFRNIVDAELRKLGQLD